ncbi:MAG: hypothetical protein K2M87_06495 [Muribaculaceae bacterium]|nr:hypothetical protein [Muribaculaceae bacterium]
MKKIILAGLLCSCMSSWAITPPPSNEAFYLVGTMNNWQTPDPEYAPTWEYKLTDPDGDGLYTGTFDIPAGQLEFKVFSKPGDWNNKGDYYGAIGNLNVFDTFTWKTLLFNEANTGNITVRDWKGGKLEMRISWAVSDAGDKYLPIMSMRGLNQPAAPALPKMYAVGDFNDWKIPTSTSANGALDLTTSYASLAINGQKLMDRNAGNIEMAFCCLNADGKCLMYKTSNEFKAPFTLYNYPGGDQYYSIYGRWTESSDPQNCKILIKDWKGGSFNTSVNIPYQSTDETVINFDIISTPVQPALGTMYLLFDYNGEKEIKEIGDYTRLWGFVEGAPGEEVSMLLTNEDSLNPAPENCWGIKSALEYYGFDRKNRTGDLELVRGGYPISMTFDDGGLINADFYLNASVVKVFTDYYTPADLPEKLYICGNVASDNDGELIWNNFHSPSESNREVYDKYFSLEKIDGAIYHGTFWMNSEPDEYGNPPQFRLFTGLNGWVNETSLGSGYADFTYEEVDLNSGYSGPWTIVKGGLGNWAPTVSNGREGNWIELYVDMNYISLYFYLKDSGVDDIYQDSQVDGKDLWFNLQGIQVENPSNGIYIHVKGGKSQVETVR